MSSLYGGRTRRRGKQNIIIQTVEAAAIITGVGLGCVIAAPFVAVTAVTQWLRRLGSEKDRR